ncbi:16S rRNA (cytosine(1402)-N(4))-methyltransferase RsmH [Candidatus Peregrinibacteria bacterium]|nr:16S rRNA (cytosine(1402)-N(4))-methyltransferase RsmH [Candidatus Peregrinibacteria bacterium]
MIDRRSLHKPVLVDEVLNFLNVQKKYVIVDATLGLGGHAKRILEKLSSKGRLIALDADRDNLKIAKENLKEYREKIDFYHSNFENLARIVHDMGYTSIDGILFDLGIASLHVDDPSKGFSFLRDGPLDMRFDKTCGQTAADLINTLSEENLRRIFQEYGEERHARSIAKLIIARRRKKKFFRTLELSSLIESVSREKRKHPATRVFQALRIAVNRELEVLRRGLNQALELLQPQGRMVVISYHSLEDRIVKNFFRTESKSCICPPEIILCQCHHQKSLDILTKKPITPSLDEIHQNPRSRSACLRAARKISLSIQ